MSYEDLAAIEDEFDDVDTEISMSIQSYAEAVLEYGQTD